MRQYTCKWHQSVKIVYPVVVDEETGEETRRKVTHIGLFVDDSAPVCDSGRYRLSWSGRSKSYILKIVPRVNVGDKIHYEYEIDPSRDPNNYKFDCYMTIREVERWLSTRFPPDEALKAFWAIVRPM